MSAISDWETFAGATSIAYLLALLRLRVDLASPTYLALFAVVLVEGLVLVLQGLAPPDLEVRLLRFRLGRVGRAVEWAAGVALTALTWVALDEPLAAVALGIGVGYLWTRRGDHYDDFRERIDRLKPGEPSAGAEKP